jgi:hypothetical protein
VAPVGRIDGVALPGDPGFLATVAQVYESVPWEAI